jgi:aerobic carbon-monoxide dehydrogenase large subunit
MDGNLREMLDVPAADNSHETTLRVEDDALLRGKGKFIDDLKLANQAIAVFVRSPYAHADIQTISTEAALAVPGVIAVLTAADMESIATVSRPIPIAGRDGKPTVVPVRPVLAAKRVMHVGDAVALVIAESAEIATDAAEQVEVEYEMLPAITDGRGALAQGAPQIWPDAAENLAVDYFVPSDDGAALSEVDEIIASAAHVVTNDTVNQRLAGVTIEPRGATAIYDASADRYTLHCPCQGTGVLANGLAGVMGIAPEKLRVLADDVGGAFGIKTPPYPEYPALLIAAQKIGRPVHWMATRAEAFLSDHQARDQHCKATLGLDENGKFLALKIEAISNIGAYCTYAGPMISTTGFAGCFPTTYDIAKMSINVRCVFTNTVPVGPYRGAGRPEANYVMERLVEAAARQLGMDPFEIRRRNFIAPQAMPYQTAAGHTFDSGEFGAIFEETVVLSDVEGYSARRDASTAGGRLRGLGISCFLEHSGVIPFEGTAFVFDDDKLRVRLGMHASGQGHATVFRNVVADRLGLDRDSVILEEGDSDFAIKGGPAIGSRSAMSAGPAMAEASDIVTEKGRRIAAGMLEASEDDIGYEKGGFVVAGTDRRVGLFEVAKRAADMANNGEIEESLDTRATAKMPSTYPNGCHIVEVEIEPETGIVTVLRYSAIDDCGTVLDRTIADGQTIGGVAQGLGQALIEAVRYDEDGQVQTGSMMDYGIPRADMMPSEIVAAFHPVACTTNVLGVKGIGEAGTTAAIGAIMNAIADAIPDGRGIDIAMPATPEKIWRACNG